MTDDIAKRIRACRLCSDRFAATHSAHGPRPILRLSASARVCIASQAPGIRAHNAGVPFQDPSGKRLRAWMAVDETVFYDTSRIAILPMAFCFPGHDAKGGDRPPPPVCARTWRDAVFQAAPAFDLVLLIGGYAQKWHLGPAMPRTLTQAVANWRDPAYVRGRTRYFPLPHPSWRNNAWLKANPWFEFETLPDLRSSLAPLL